MHHAQAVQQWLSEHETQIELVFLPSYSPQLNLVEYLNGACFAGSSLQSAESQFSTIASLGDVSSSQAAKVTCTINEG